MPQEPAAHPEPATGGSNRLTLSRMLEMMIQKSPRDHSSVTLTRNAKGETQIEVVVRTGDSGDVTTPDEAMAKAIELYDDARSRYLFPVVPETGGRS